MKKQQIVILLLFTMLTPCLLQAQKKELDQARTYIKSGKDFDKAEKLMTDLLKKDTANRHNKKIYDTWLESLEGQYAAANEKFYLKQKYDTAAFYKIVHRMYVVAETLDSLDMVPDKKGRVKLEFRKSNAAMLDRLRPNLYNGGNYNVNHNDYKTAYTFFSTYIDADSQPLFTGYKYLTNDQRMPTAAYWATYCGFRMEDAPRTLAYSELALKDVSKQLAANPKAEICAFKDGRWLRVAGELVNDDDRSVKVAMLEKMPTLGAMYDPDDGNMQMLYFRNAAATFSSFTEAPETICF